MTSYIKKRTRMQAPMELFSGLVELNQEYHLQLNQEPPLERELNPILLDLKNGRPNALSLPAFFMEERFQGNQCSQLKQGLKPSGNLLLSALLLPIEVASLLTLLFFFLSLSISSISQGFSQSILFQVFLFRSFPGYRYKRL